MTVAAHRPWRPALLLCFVADYVRSRLPGVTMYCQDDLANHIAVMAFNINGFEAGETGTILDVDYDIACRTGLHCAPMVAPGRIWANADTGWLPMFVRILF